MLALASAWSVGTVIDTSTHQKGVLLVLDATWPLSMVGLVVVAVAILRAGRFHGVSRFAPLAGSMWLLADGIGVALNAGRPVHIAWMLGSYGWLSWVLFNGQPAAINDSDAQPRPDQLRLSVDSGQA